MEMAWQSFLKFPNNKCKQNRFINFRAVLCTWMDVEDCKDGCKAHLLCTLRKTDWLQPCELVSIAASRVYWVCSALQHSTHTKTLLQRSLHDTQRPDLPRAFARTSKCRYWDWKRAKNGPSAMSETSAEDDLSF